jgi:D-alanyl-D-alanine dipeptidase
MLLFLPNSKSNKITQREGKYDMLKRDSIQDLQNDISGNVYNRYFISLIENFSLIAILIIFFTTVSLANDADPELKSGFVYLSDIDPSILINLKYHQDENFTGVPIAGCSKGRAVVTIDAAEALRNVQEDLVMHGYALVVYDAYHPLKSQDKFNAWLQGQSVDTKDSYYPNLTKIAIKEAGYIEAKYPHVRGSTVDVSIISLKDKLTTPCKQQKRSYKNQKDLIYLNDGTAEMGTSYDTFDPLSSYSNTTIPQEAQVHRKLLREIMQNHGFTPNEKFWWQFTLIREPYIDSEFDFDI